MIKEIQYGGYATEPSDYECSEGQLCLSLNLISEDQQLKPLFQPATLCELPSGYVVMCKHHVTKPEDYFIVYDPAGKRLWSLALSPSQGGGGLTEIHCFGQAEVTKVQPVGNTLVVLATDGVHYILWSGDAGTGGGYVYLGQKIPELKVRFGLDVSLTCFPKDRQVGEATFVQADRAEVSGFISGSENVVPFWSDEGAWIPPKDAGDRDSWRGSWSFSLEGVKDLPTMSSVTGRWTDFALGNVNRLIAERMKEEEFVFPFFVRWAYELHDGSHVMHSDPVLLIPGSKYPFFAMDGDHGFEMQDVGNDNRDFRFRGRAYGFAGRLMAEIINGDNGATIDALGRWKDIVRGIDIFVSAPIYTYDQSGKVYGWTNMDDEGAWDDFFTHGRTDWPGHTDYCQHRFDDIFRLWNAASAPDREDRYYRAYDNSHPLPDYILTMPEKTAEDILRSVESAAFYKVASYKLDDESLRYMQAGARRVTINEGVLESLLARETLEGDYHSRDLITAKGVFAYNSRVNLSGIKRSLHAPLSAAVAWPKDESAVRSWTLIIEYKDGGQRRVLASEAGANGCAMPRYLFYGDRRASTVWLTCADGGTTHRWRLPLTEHPLLEGAYWWGGLGAVISESEMAAGEEIPTVSDAPVDEANKVYTSMADDPFVFPLNGINTVGTGEVLGICAAVKALSQGQFGAFPLYAFCTDGVWALKVNGEGLYSAEQPVTMDVCINAGSITQLDETVLFASARGIMQLSGSTAICLTDGIAGERPFDVTTLPGMTTLHGMLGHGMDGCIPVRGFLGFLKGCRMVYDYVHQRVVVFNAETVSADGEEVQAYTYAYVYSLKSRRWGMMYSRLKSAVNAYPDAVAMTTDDRVVSFDGTDEAVSRGLMVTRPLKLDAPDVLKTVRTVIQRGRFSRGDVASVLWGSRDLERWFAVWSSKDHYMRYFSGTPYKYFRIGSVTELREGQSVFGASVDYVTRGTDQVR